MEVEEVPEQQRRGLPGSAAVLTPLLKSSQLRSQRRSERRTQLRSELAAGVQNHLNLQSDARR